MNMGVGHYNMHDVYYAVIVDGGKHGTHVYVGKNATATLRPVLPVLYMIQRDQQLH